MAIFMATTKSISRGNGQSAVASAAYRSGQKLQDERYGKTQNYKNRGGVMSAEIILPNHLKGQIEIDRNTLWNLAERMEKRKDARVGREWIVNLPYELDETVRKQLAHTFAQSLADKYGVIADCCIHRPTEKEIERGADPRNFHAHIMLTTRQAQLSAEGNIVLGEKATIELSDSKRRSLGLERVSVEISEIRELWERLANVKLAEYGHELIDSRSYQSQGIDIVPQLKMGKNATQLERDGIATAVGDINRLIKERNELVFNRELADIKRTNQLADEIIINSRQSHQKMPVSTPVSDELKTDPVLQRTRNAVEPSKEPSATQVAPIQEISHQEAPIPPSVDVHSAVSSTEPTQEKIHNELMAKYERWKQQKQAIPQTTPSPAGNAISTPNPMSFNERRQAWQAEQARKKQEAEEQQRLAEQARLAAIAEAKRAEQERQAQIARQQEQARELARQQAIAEQQRIAEEQRLAQIAEQQKLAQQEQERQREIERQNYRGFRP